MTRSALFVVWFLCATIFALAGGCDGDDDDGSTDSDSDTDGDTDTDTDTDADTDSDGDSDTGPDCTSCHGNPPSTGQHFNHYGYPCATCHGSVVDQSGQIIDEELHEDGLPDIDLTSGTYSDGVCSSTSCHGSPVSW